MKILFNAWRDLSHPQAGGSEVLVDGLARGLHDRGHDVGLLCGGPLAEHDYPAVDAGGTFTQYLRAPLLYHRHFLDRDLAVDVSNGMTFFSPLWRRRPTVCLVHHVHTEQWREHFSPSAAWLGRNIESRLMPRVYRDRLFIAMSPSTADDLAGLGIDPNRVRVLPQAIDPPLLHVERSVEPLFLALGRLTPHKRVDLLLDMWREAHPRIGGRLVIVGDGPDRARLEGLGTPAVEFRGVIDESEKHRLYGSAWILVHAASREGWGLVISEAANHATPALAFDVRGVRDAIRDGGTGLLAPGRREFVESWVSLAADSPRRRALGESARAWSSTLTNDNTVDHFEEIAEEAVSEHYLPSTLRRQSKRLDPRRTTHQLPLLFFPPSDDRPPRSEIKWTYVIPAFNEELRLPQLLRQLISIIDLETTEIIVADDGSTDGTVAIASTMLGELTYASVLTCRHNQGKGAAVRRGVLAARGRRVAFMDADTATDLEVLGRLDTALDEFQVVVGSRSTPGAEVQNCPVHRIAMGRMFNAWTRLNTGISVLDTQCGLKAYRTPVAKLLYALSRVDSFAFDVEILDLAGRLGLTMGEVPVRWTGIDGSKVRVINDSFHMAVDVLRISSRTPRLAIPALKLTKTGFDPPSACRQLSSSLRVGDVVLPFGQGALALFPGANLDVRGTVGRRLGDWTTEPYMISASALIALSRQSISRGLTTV